MSIRLYFGLVLCRCCFYMRAIVKYTLFVTRVCYFAWILTFVWVVLYMCPNAAWYGCLIVSGTVSLHIYILCRSLWDFRVQPAASILFHLYMSIFLFMQGLLSYKLHKCSLDNQKYLKQNGSLYSLSDNFKNFSWRSFKSKRVINKSYQQKIDILMKLCNPQKLGYILYVRKSIR